MEWYWWILIFLALAGIAAAVAVAAAFPPKKDCKRLTEGCAGAGDCCPGLVCIKGQCGKVLPPPPAQCGKLRESCAGAGECCAGLVCIKGQCGKVLPPPPAQCGKLRESCARAGECCAGLVCIKGQCGKVLPPPPAQCGKLGESCAENACCSGLACGPGKTCGQQVADPQFLAPVQPDQPGVPCTTGNCYWSTSYPQLSQMRKAYAAGVRIFRIPFRAESVMQLTTGWASGWGGRYAKPHPEYLDYVMYAVASALGLGAGDARVILDCHNYQRWCPIGIGGTGSCLDPGSQDPSRQYAMNAEADALCPFKVLPGTAEELGRLGFGSLLSVAGNPGAMPDTVAGCQNNVQQSTADPGKYLGNATASVIGVKCMQVLWWNLLHAPFTLYSGCDGAHCLRQTGHTLADYANANPRLWLGLMNEPNEVDSEGLAEASAQAFRVVRALCPRTPITVMGNYWGGLHAQVTAASVPAPEGVTAGCVRPDSTSEGWWRQGGQDQSYADLLLRSLRGLGIDLGEWYYDVHQYFDSNGSGIHDCAANPCATERDIAFFTGFTDFANWCARNDVRMVITEFGAQQGFPACVAKLKAFLDVLYSAPQKTSSGAPVVRAWTLWRTCPAITWPIPYDPSSGTYKFSEQWSNCVQFGCTTPVCGQDPACKANAANTTPINPATNKVSAWTTLCDSTADLTRTVLPYFAKNPEILGGVNMTAFDQGRLVNAANNSPEAVCRDSGDASGGWFSGVCCTQCGTSCTEQAPEQQKANAFRPSGKSYQKT